MSSSRSPIRRVPPPISSSTAAAPKRKAPTVVVSKKSKPSKKQKKADDVRVQPDTVRLAKRRSSRVLRSLRSLNAQTKENGCDALVVFMTHGRCGKVMASGTRLGRKFFKRRAVRAAFEDVFLARRDTDSPELAMAKARHPKGRLEYDPFKLPDGRRSQNDSSASSSRSSTKNSDDSSSSPPSSPIAINQDEAF